MCYHKIKNFFLLFYKRKTYLLPLLRIILINVRRKFIFQKTHGDSKIIKIASVPGLIVTITRSNVISSPANPT